MNIDGTVAVVTGGASGLGLATITELVAHGAKAVMVDLPASDGDSKAKKLGDTVHFVPADVRDTDAVSSAMDVAEQLGPLRITVNCAGIGPAKRVVDRDDCPAELEWFTNILNTNLVGTFNVLRLAAARMMRQEPDGEERGVVVNTASVAAFDGQIGQAAYSASKGGVVAMTLPIARDLANKQIRVMTIAPGLFMTPLLRGLPSEALDSLGNQVPHPSRLGSPPEFAAMVRHIVENPMLNGETIRLDGAIRMAPR